MLNGQVVILRAPTRSDEDFLFGVRNDFESQAQLMALPRANSTHRVSEWINGLLGDPRSVFFVAADAGDQCPIGFLQIRNMDFVHGHGELGIYISKDTRRRGAGAEALQLLESYVARTFNLRKVVLKVLVTNSGACEFYKKLGYSLVGTHRKHFYNDHAFHDVAVMEKLL